MSSLADGLYQRADWRWAQRGGATVTHGYRRNPRGFSGYNQNCWGITASDGPGPATGIVDGVTRRFFDYKARGAPYGPDDGTIGPWTVVASLPFAPDIVVPAIRHLVDEVHLDEPRPYGFRASFNASYPVAVTSDVGWVSPWHFGLNQGPIVLMIENHRTGLIWKSGAAGCDASRVGQAGPSRERTTWRSSSHELCTRAQTVREARSTMSHGSDASGSTQSITQRRGSSWLRDSRH